MSAVVNLNPNGLNPNPNGAPPVQPIADALPDEQIVGVAPVLAHHVTTTWHRRLRFFTGRSLSDVALTVEQNDRAGRLATRGQSLSPGVLAGLEVGIDQATVGGQRTFVYHVAAGSGLAATGEDVVLPLPARVGVSNVPVYAPNRLLDRTGAPPVDRGLEPRRLGPSLGDAIAKGIALPPVGMLLLQPVVAEDVGRPNPTDSCEIDPSADAFADWRIVDGTRFVWYAWPTEWLPLPDPDARWRNRLAYAVFEAAARAGTAPFPWEQVGVPIALVAFDVSADQKTWTPRFADRSSVVRPGGRPRRRTQIFPAAGDPGLWQARVQQLAEQLAELSADSANGPAVQLAAQIRFLPPFGLLPRDAVDLPNAANQFVLANRFFPPSFAVGLAPVPVEQLDLAMRESASLAPFDTFVTDQVEVLVPVPQVWYEPDLLVPARVDPAFQREIDADVAERANWLHRRQLVRARAAAIVKAITGQPPQFPATDPDQLEPESSTLPKPFPGVAAHQSDLQDGLHWHAFAGANPALPIAAGDRLYAYVYLDPNHPPTELMLQWGVKADWEHRAYWGADAITADDNGAITRAFVGPLPPAGSWQRLEVPASVVGLRPENPVDGMRFTLFGGRAVWGDAGKVAANVPWVTPDLVANHAQTSALGDTWHWIDAEDLLTPFEDDYQTVPFGDARAAQPVLDLKNSLSKGPLRTEVAAIDALGLEKFVRALQAKVDRANDQIDRGFLRVQTDVYRHRQLMLGNENATRLATSPTLATIAQGVSAAGTRDDLATFYEILKKTTVPVRTMALDATGQPNDHGAAPDGGAGASATDGDRSAHTDGSNAPPALAHSLASFSTIGAHSVASVVEAPIGEIGKIGGIVAPERLPLADETAIKTIGRAPVGLPVDVKEVLDQEPVVGFPVLRNATVGERLAAPKAPEAKQFSLATKFDVIGSLQKLGQGDNAIDLSDVEVPGLPVYKDNQPQYDPRDPSGQPLRQPAPLLKLDPNEILREPPPNVEDEAAHFVGGVELLDHTIAVLRLIEGRVAAYRDAITACQSTLAVLRDLADQTDQRLKAIGDDVTRSRHLVATARALLADETNRVNAVNARRAQILAEQVTFLVYRRPRTAELLRPAPSRALDPGLSAATIPACLADDSPLPPELRAMVDLIRQAPVRWLVGVRPLLNRLDRLDLLLGTIQAAQTRATLQVAPAQSNGNGAATPIGGSILAPKLLASTRVGSALGQAVGRAFGAQQQALAQTRIVAANLDLTALAGLTWQQSRAQATEVVAIGDLIDAGHGRSDVVQAATAELDNIARVAGCLYQHASEALPVVRLAWANALSEYAAPVNLRNLASLPRWGEVDALDRREMQTVVDWLYGRVDPTIPAAVALISDLIRVALLLASDAPVDRIIAGQVSRPSVSQPGDRIGIAVDPTIVHVGMNAVLYQTVGSASTVIAQGIVEDLAASEVVARLSSTRDATVNLDSSIRVRFVEASTIGGIS